MKLLASCFIALGLAAACFAGVGGHRVGHPSPEQMEAARYLIDSYPGDETTDTASQCIPGCSIKCPPPTPDGASGGCSVSAGSNQTAECFCRGSSPICYTRPC